MNLQIFTSEQYGEIRTLEENGNILFCGSDVAKALGYARPNDAISAHCRCAVKRSIPHPQSTNKQIEVVFITEGDVYRLITHSKLPKAEKFECWVFDEVLPSIRKTGSYSTQNCAQFPPKATSAGEVSSLIKNVRITMERQNSAPIKVAQQTELLLRHFGIPVIEDFTETPSQWEQPVLE